jgi:hypothetical protein
VIDKATLIANTRVVKHRTVTIPGVGDVEVRGLTRAESLQAQEAETKADLECRAIAAGLVEPAMTVEEVAEWQASSLSVALDIVTKAIFELSAMLPGQQEEAEARFRQG